MLLQGQQSCQYQAWACVHVQEYRAFSPNRQQTKVVKVFKCVVAMSFTYFAVELLDPMNHIAMHWIVVIAVVLWTDHHWYWCHYRLQQSTYLDLVVGNPFFHSSVVRARVCVQRMNWVMRRFDERKYCWRICGQYLFITLSFSAEISIANLDPIDAGNSSYVQAHAHRYRTKLLQKRCWSVSRRHLGKHTETHTHKHSITNTHVRMSNWRNESRYRIIRQQESIQ